MWLSGTYKLSPIWFLGTPKWRTVWVFGHQNGLNIHSFEITNLIFLGVI